MKALIGLSTGLPGNRKDQPRKNILIRYTDMPMMQLVTGMVLLHIWVVVAGDKGIRRSVCMSREIFFTPSCPVDFLIQTTHTTLYSVIAKRIAEL